VFLIAFWTDFNHMI